MGGAGVETDMEMSSDSDWKMHFRKIQPDEYVALLLCAAGTLGVLPFAIMRLSQGEWIIGIIDSVIVLSMASLGIFVFRTQRVRPASIYLAVLCVSGALITVYLKGSSQVFWTYPAFMVGFYLLEPKEAVLLVLAAVAVLIPALQPIMEFSLLGAVLVTLLITCTVAYSFSIQTRTQHEQLAQLATCDPLTGAGNRRALEAEMDRVIALRNRSGTPCSLLLIDLDHFKRINDTHGHGQGDQTLSDICSLIRSRIRKSDTLFRVGGEEFVVTASNDHIGNAERLANDLCQAVASHQAFQSLGLTISVGVAELVAGETRKEWLDRADKALYNAKNAGRNCVHQARFPSEKQVETLSQESTSDSVSSTAIR